MFQLLKLEQVLLTLYAVRNFSLVEAGRFQMITR